MSKVTSKLQITVPKAVAEELGICPGDEVEWLPAGDSVRLVPAGRSRPVLDLEGRIRFFDQSTERQRTREKQSGVESDREASSRGWTRDELYERG